MCLSPFLRTSCFFQNWFWSLDSISTPVASASTRDIKGLYTPCKTMVPVRQDSSCFCGLLSPRLSVYPRFIASLLEMGCKLHVREIRGSGVLNDIGTGHSIWELQSDCRHVISYWLPYIGSLENESSTLLPLTQWSLRPFLTFDAQRPFWDQDFKSILCVVSTIPWQDSHSEHETFSRARQWGYFGSTPWQIASCMIQFLLNNIVGHTRLCGVCFAACLAATVLHD